MVYGVWCISVVLRLLTRRGSLVKARVGEEKYWPHLNTRVQAKEAIQGWSSLKNTQLPVQDAVIHIKTFVRQAGIHVGARIDGSNASDRRCEPPPSPLGPIFC